MEGLRRTDGKENIDGRETGPAELSLTYKHDQPKADHSTLILCEGAILYRFS